MADNDIERLVKTMARLPGLGPRSAKRAVLHLLTNKDKTLTPLLHALQQAEQNVRECTSCGNLDSTDPCHICQDPKRQSKDICVIAGVADLWAIERTHAYRGRYHVLGGVLSALDGIAPADLKIDQLLTKIKDDGINEVILALSATVDGQSTSHYLSDKILAAAPAVKITRLAHGVPVGGELDYLDDGTISTALRART